MPRGMEVGLGQGVILLDGDPAPLLKGHSTPTFRPCLLWPNSWMDQEFKMPLGTEVGLGPGHIVLDGDPARPEMGTANPRHFPRPYLFSLNGWMLLIDFELVSVS